MWAKREPVCGNASPASFPFFASYRQRCRPTTETVVLRGAGTETPDRHDFGLPLPSRPNWPMMHANDWLASMHIRPTRKRETTSSRLAHLADLRDMKTNPYPVPRTRVGLV